MLPCVLLPLLLTSYMQSTLHSRKGTSRTVGTITSFSSVRRSWTGLSREPHPMADGDARARKSVLLLKIGICTCKLHCPRQDSCSHRQLNKMKPARRVTRHRCLPPHRGGAATRDSRNSYRIFISLCLYCTSLQ